ncbi:hypothetical protein F4778DRAFT_654543 [Xylariomycetidae sp. FL2044]|nr:hypothetical protein F4778DRAFT_654543 [Xylariomycetidae sp. FL2044]
MPRRSHHHDSVQPDFWLMHLSHIHPAAKHGSALRGPRIATPLIHPLARGKFSGTERTHHHVAFVDSAADSTNDEAEQASLTPHGNEVDTEIKVSLAAKQLAAQLVESRNFWLSFHDEYEREVSAIKHYAGEEILEKIWQKKVEHKSLFKDHEDDQFLIQRMKLETCLKHVGKATQLFMALRVAGVRAGHNSRRHHLEKIRAGSAIIIDLANKSMLDGKACTDLLTELSSLQLLVDPANPSARILHKFECQGSREVHPYAGNEEDKLAGEEKQLGDGEKTVVSSPEQTGEGWE